MDSSTTGSPFGISFCSNARDQRPQNHDKHFTFLVVFFLVAVSQGVCLVFSVCDVCFIGFSTVLFSNECNSLLKALCDLIKMYMVCFLFFTITELIILFLMLT